MIITILLFLIILAILILVHETGHFVAAKMFGIRVEEFGLGFPPKIFAKKIGETTYTLNAVPFGGFVKIFGEDALTEIVSESDKARSFHYKPKWMQAIVLLAGITMNIVFAYLLISAGFMIGLPAPVDSSAYGQPQNMQLVITSVLAQSPAEKAGLIPGDVIISASAGQNIVQSLSPESVSDLIAKSQSPITITYDPGDNSPQQTVTVKPSDTIVSGRPAIGIVMDMIGILKLSPVKALLQGAVTTWQLFKSIVIGLFDFFKQLFTFKSDLSQVSGPIGIAKVVGEARAIGFVYLLSLVALISLNLAVINLIPFPALDGGRLFFIFIEAITRRKMNPKVVNWVNGIGFALLLILMVVVSIHDVLGIV